MTRWTEIVAAATVAASLSWATPGRAEWRRTSEIELNTAYTLEERTLSFGFFSPLSVGVTESFQASIHPILLLLGQPSLAFRLRLTPVDTVTVALNVAGTWSFINRETAEGVVDSKADDGEEVGFPGTLQLGATVTFAAGRSWLVSVGAGPAADFLGEDPIRGLAELHVGVHWLPAARHLVMLQANGYLDITDDGALLRPSAQLIYAWAASSHVHLMLGIGLGDWEWQESDGSRRSVNVFPLVDVVLRF